MRICGLLAISNKQLLNNLFTVFFSYGSGQNDYFWEKSGENIGNNNLKVSRKLLFLGKSQGNFVLTARINPVNPLSANVGYIRHDTVVTSDSCNSGHSENYENILTFSCKSLKFSTKWYTKLCILVDPFLRNCVKFSIFFLKKAQKKALALKGLTVFTAKSNERKKIIKK